MVRAIAVMCVICVLGMALYAAQGNQPGASKSKGKTANPARKTAPKKAASEEKTIPPGGAVVFVDPVTRQVREATPADIGTLSILAPPAALAPPSPPVFIQGPGGAIGVVLGPEFQTYTVVTKTPEGKLRSEEVSGERAVQERVVPSQTPKSPNGK